MMNYLVDLHMAQERPKEIELPANGTSLDLLRAVYRNPSLALPVRMRAAIAALPHEVPRLQVTAQVNENSFAELLERRLKHMEEINNSNGLEAKPAPQIETKPPKPHINDRRFRRI
jgi:hypothetical protein